MKPVELAQKHLGHLRIRGDELVPTWCPFCDGGGRKDKWTFAVNRETGAYNCKRGSCGVSGGFRELCQHFGEDVGSTYELYTPPVRRYKPPQTNLSDPDQVVSKYLQLRGISESTWRRRRVSEADGNLVFPYYEDGDLVLVKFRPAHKLSKGERKGWRETGGKPVFWGMDDCDPALPLCIVEGEMDALALDEAGVPNVVSVPSGAEDLTCVDICWDWLQRFKQVIIWPDHDKPGREMCRRLIQRLGAWRCSVVQTQHKDANLALYREGAEATRALVDIAVEVPISGLIRLADVKPFDHTSTLRVRSSIHSINRIIGGYMGGQVSVWTGVPGSGKSTFLGQELLTAVNQGVKVCAYSGELPAGVFRYWIDLQAAGPKNLEQRIDELRGRDDSGEPAVVQYPHSEVVPKIRDWYRDKFFLHDAFGCTTDEALLEVFAYAAMRYECRVFLIDNLMTTDFTTGEKDFFRRQSAFVGRVIDFAQRHEAHVHLVAHPRKTSDTDARIARQDVSGSADVTNRADNVFSVSRTSEAARLSDLGGPAAEIVVLKNRFSGVQDRAIELDFQPESRRFFLRSSHEGPRWQYGWESNKGAKEAPNIWESMGVEVEVDPDELPF